METIQVLGLALITQVVIDMNRTGETSDVFVVDLLRRDGPLSVSDLAQRTQVTATAVRQRLQRLMGQGLVERRVARAGRGRPSHRYSLTEEGVRAAGTNYGDLALLLWKEMRSVQDPHVRRGLLKRVSVGLASLYGSRVRGGTLSEKMKSLGKLFAEKGIPFDIEESQELPALKAVACPYPDLAEQDRGICAVEKMAFSEMLGQDVRLAKCRLDGANCCTFEVS
ncbi:MAG: winged helix DNA-binding protein [Planctomycetia bacterium]|nr:MAG: winged helix DNA-binding protein [Planctomycetia bacterium]